MLAILGGIRAKSEWVRLTSYSFSLLYSANGAWNSIFLRLPRFSGWKALKFAEAMRVFANKFHHTLQFLAVLSSIATARGQIFVCKKGPKDHCIWNFSFCSGFWLEVRLDRLLKVHVVLLSVHFCVRYSGTTRSMNCASMHPRKHMCRMIRNGVDRYFRQKSRVHKVYDLMRLVADDRIWWALWAVLSS